MVEIEGKVSNTSISISIDPSVFQIYVSPRIVETCKLDKVKHEKLWLVIPFALTNARTNFMFMMNNIISKYLDNCIGIYRRHTRLVLE